MDITLPSRDLSEAIAHPLFRGLLETCSDGAVVIDAQSRRILAMNTRARQLLGYAEQELVGCQCRVTMNSPACAIACPLTAQIDGDRSKDEVTLYYRGQSPDRPLHANTRMLVVRGPDGAPLAGIELFRDLGDVITLERRLRERRSLHGIIGQSAPMQSLYDLVEQVAPYDLPVLITGESGVGKERFADAVQYLSDRADGPYIKVNCAALSPSLVESELFGHKKGAFTGATHERRGCFEEASGGTLLLDEVGELPLLLQAKLLRAIQEGEVQRVGEDRPRKVDVRVLAATNREVEREVAEGRFREDLYYRLAGVRLHVAPLRERPEDIPLLSEHFLSRWFREAEERGRPRAATRLTAAATQALLERPWRGNVRELENALRLAFIRVPPGKDIGPEHILGITPRTGPEPASLNLAEIERKAIQRALDRSDGNMTTAAQLLGIDRTTLWRKLRKNEAAI